MSKPRIADLFCGAGGAGMGLHRAGFEVVGYDLAPQPNYPFEFHQQDALDVDLSGFAAVWASPPCQAYSRAKSFHGVQDHYVDLIPQTRALVHGMPSIIENVVGAPLRVDVELCGLMFGLKTYRHRWFECGWEVPLTLHPPHEKGLTVGQSRYSSFRNGCRMITIAGHNFNAAEGREAMGISWMQRKELAQAIPPAYSEYLGARLLATLTESATHG